MTITLIVDRGEDYTDELIVTAETFQDAFLLLAAMVERMHLYDFRWEGEE